MDQYLLSRHRKRVFAILFFFLLFPAPLPSGAEWKGGAGSFPKKNFSFRGIKAAFSGSFNFSQIGEMEEEFLIKKMEARVDSSLRSRFRSYAPMIFKMSRKYHVDPFWAIAIMWVESSFRKNALSPVGARGLMQVMPRTGQYLASKLRAYHYGPPWEREYKEIAHPPINIEMGVFYLSYLLKKYKGSSSCHQWATIAYNMGPGRLRYVKRKGFPIEKRSRYLKKVQKIYLDLLRPFTGEGKYGRTTGSTGVDQSGNSLALL